MSRRSLCPLTTASALFAAALFLGVGTIRAQPVGELALRELPNRPDHWPESITMKVDAEFGATTVKKGQTFKLVEYDGNNVVFEAKPGELLAVTPDDCDLLEAANKMWASLSPAQKAVDILSLPKDASLWPEKVTVNSEFSLTTGAVIPAGTEYDLTSVEPQYLNIYTAKPAAARLQTAAKQTDVFKRARELAAIEPDKRPSRIVNALKGHLVDASGKPVTPESLEQTKLFVLYFGASWCQPCRAFSPELVKFVNDNAAANPHMTVVLLSCDEKDPDLFKYMQEEKMPFPAVKNAELVQLGSLYGFGCGSIPQMVVTDRYGKVLANTFENSQYVGPKRTLAALKKIVASGVAK